MLAGFVGYAVISKVPNTLHTPLMSGTNAIHGIVLLGGMIVLGLSGDGFLNKLLLVIAVVFGTINVVGGFLVTDRMLEMFKGKKPHGAVERRGGGPDVIAASFLHDANFITSLYIVAFGLFIYGLSGLTGPEHRGARQPHRRGRHGASRRRHAARSTGMGNWGLIVARRRRSAPRSACPAARQVKMTAMPQMVALFNGVGGGAVALIAWVEFRESGGFADEPTYVAIFSCFAAIVGSVSFWGSNIAFGKLQEILPGRPITARPRPAAGQRRCCCSSRVGLRRWRSSPARTARS